MGSLHYGSPPASFQLDDRTLAHVELVVLAKLRRNESFALTIDEAKGGRSTIWINASSTLRFEFAAQGADINREWLEELIDSANTTAGMKIVPEPSTGPTTEPKTATTPTGASTTGASKAEASTSKATASAATKAASSKKASAA